MSQPVPSSPPKSPNTSTSTSIPLPPPPPPPPPPLPSPPLPSPPLTSPLSPLPPLPPNSPPSNTASPRSLPDLHHIPLHQSDPSESPSPSTPPAPGAAAPSRDAPASSRRHSTHSLLSRLRVHSHRLRIAKMRAQFEHTLLTILTLNIVYMYYIDHKLLVLIIRASQFIRLLYFPLATPTAQRGTAILLLVSNVPVVLVHQILFSGPNIASSIGKMLFINFIGTEPKSLLKVVIIDFITIALQALILQCRWNPTAIPIISALPVPAADDLIPVEQDPNIIRSNEPNPVPQHQNDHDENTPPGTTATT